MGMAVQISKEGDQQECVVDQDSLNFYFNCFLSTLLSLLLLPLSSLLVLLHIIIFGVVVVMMMMIIRVV